MYRITFTSLIAVSLLLVFVHSNHEFSEGEVREDDAPGRGGGMNPPPNRVRLNSAIRTNSQFQVKNTVIQSRPPFGINKGNAGGNGNAQTQGGENSNINTSGGNGGVGGSVRGAGGQNIGGRGGDGNSQTQGGTGSVITNSGGNGGAGGSVDGSQPIFPSDFPFRQSTTKIENSVSANKRDFIASSSINSFPSFPFQNVGGRGGDGHVQVQVQGGGFNTVSGGNGGSGGNSFGSQPGFQSLTNMQNSVSTDKRELGSGKNVSRVD